MTPEILPPLTLVIGPDEDPAAVLHREVCTVTEAMFTEDGEHPAAWYILFGNNRVQGFLTPWENDREQIASRDYICLLVHLMKAKAYAFVTEAYVAVVKNAKTPAEVEAERAKWPERLVDLPEDQRDEILMVMTTTPDHRSTTSRWIINSKGKHRGRKPFLGPKVDETTYEKMEGRMVDLFGQRPSAHGLATAYKLAAEMGIVRRKP